MSYSNNNIDIVPVTGYNPSFSWQVGINSFSNIVSPLQFRATIRPLHGLEDFTRIPSTDVLYEETGIFINTANNQGQWSFPLSVNSLVPGGPYRDYQVVIEAHDDNGNTSAGNLIQQNNENGWASYSQGYDIIAVSNPRQTGIELGNSLSTQYSITDTGFYQNTGNPYYSLNYMDSNGGINILYLSGIFNSNLVGGYIYSWTGQFPKLETALGISGFEEVSKTRFDFDPNGGHIFHPTAASKFRGSNHIYMSVSFYDNIDGIALDNGIDISTGLYLSDNAIAYNDISAGSLTIGGFQTISAFQYAGYADPTGLLGAGVQIISSNQSNGRTSVVYITKPINVLKYGTFTGIINSQAGGAGGNSILINSKPLKDS